MILLNTPRTLKVFDGKPTKYGQIIHIAQIDCLSFDKHNKYGLYLYITHFHHYPIIFSHLWLQKHDSYIYWKESKVMFDSFFYHSYCYINSNSVIVDRLFETNPSKIS